MNLCAQCGKRHPKVRNVVLDKWLWIDGMDNSADLKVWQRQRLQSFGHAQVGDCVKLSGRFYTRRVRAGGAVLYVIVGVISRREPWHPDTVVADASRVTGGGK